MKKFSLKNFFSFVPLSFFVTRDIFYFGIILVFKTESFYNVYFLKKNYDIQHTMELFLDFSNPLTCAIWFVFVTHIIDRDYVITEIIVKFVDKNLFEKFKGFLKKFWLGINHKKNEIGDDKTQKSVLSILNNMIEQPYFFFSVFFLLVLFKVSFYLIFIFGATFIFTIFYDIANQFECIEKIKNEKIFFAKNASLFFRAWLKNVPRRFFFLVNSWLLVGAPYFWINFILPIFPQNFSPLIFTFFALIFYLNFALFLWKKCWKFSIDEQKILWRAFHKKID